MINCQISYFLLENTNARSRATFKILYFVSLGCSFQNFVFRYKKTNGRLGTVFKILHFAVKNEQPFGCNCKILYFPVKETTGRFGSGKEQQSFNVQIRSLRVCSKSITEKFLASEYILKFSLSLWGLQVIRDLLGLPEKSLKRMLLWFL